MKVVTTRNIIAALALSTFAVTSYAENNAANQNRAPNIPGNTYWQAPNWSNFNMPPSGYNPSQMPPNYGNSRQAAPQGYMPRPPQGYRPPSPPNYRQAPTNNQSAQPNYRQAPTNNQGAQPNYRQAPMNNQAAPNVNRAAPQPSNNAYRGNMPPPPRGPYSNPNFRDNGASAYNIPGYNQYRNNSGWGNNNFFGNSGPSKWMNPNKNNMEQGWDDMINAPSRMGEMPGGWNAPEISVPNPVDMGDQFQDNIKDLPEQIRNMDVGN